MELSNKLRNDFIPTDNIDSSKNWEEYWEAVQHNNTIKKIK